MPDTNNPLLAMTPAPIDLAACDDRQLLNPPPMSGLRLLERQDETVDAPSTPRRSPTVTWSSIG
jgi:hypothetical protein